MSDTGPGGEMGLEPISLWPHSLSPCFVVCTVKYITYKPIVPSTGPGLRLGPVPVPVPGPVQCE